MTAAAESVVVDWPWPGELAAGVFRHLVHRVPAHARTIRFDGMTYHLANCGAVAIPTNTPREDWEFCPSCWPRNDCLRPAALNGRLSG
jgi:hypothetical protein